MRKAFTAIGAVIVVAALSAPVAAQTARTGPARVPPQSIPNYERAYAACFQLALRRGQNVSRGDDYSRLEFIDQCLAGKIPF